MIEKDLALQKKLKEIYPNEKVFVIPFVVLTSIQNGFTEVKGQQKNIWNKYDNLGTYIMRYDAEYNPSIVQLIPYVIIQDKETKKYLIAKRLNGDERLQSQYSFGFGGHINPEDGTYNMLLNAMIRELKEELSFNPESCAEFLGYVRDLDNTPDHLGCVFLLETSNATIIEKNNLKEYWITQDGLEKKYFHFEKWSQDIINYLYSSSK